MYCVYYVKLVVTPVFHVFSIVTQFITKFCKFGPYAGVQDMYAGRRCLNEDRESLTNVGHRYAKCNAAEGKS